MKFPPIGLISKMIIVIALFSESIPEIETKKTKHRYIESQAEPAAGIQVVQIYVRDARPGISHVPEYGKIEHLLENRKRQLGGKGKSATPF